MPKQVRQNGTIIYTDENGQYHRDDGPAIIEPDGYQAWYQHGDRHRTGGPAIIDPSDDSLEWWFEGNLHRDDGPAIEDDDGYQEWWNHGEYIRHKMPERKQS